MSTAAAATTRTRRHLVQRLVRAAHLVLGLAERDPDERRGLAVDELHEARHRLHQRPHLLGASAGTSPSICVRISAICSSTAPSRLPRIERCVRTSAAPLWVVADPGDHLTVAAGPTPMGAFALRVLSRNSTLPIVSRWKRPTSPGGPSGESSSSRACSRARSSSTRSRSSRRPASAWARRSSSAASSPAGARGRARCPVWDRAHDREGIRHRAAFRDPAAARERPEARRLSSCPTPTSMSRRSPSRRP